MSALPLLQELPGIADVVWGTVTHLAHLRLPASVLFSAAEANAGTTVLAAATAIGLAQHQRVPVCLVETNVRRPALANYLGLETRGLSDVLDGRASFEECVQEPQGCPGLLVLAAGSARAPVAGEFSTAAFGAILDRLEGRCQYLVIDSAPLLGQVESRLLLRRVDGVLLVLRAGATRLDDAMRAHDILIESGAPVFGSIFNDYSGSGHFAGNLRAQAPRPHPERERAVFVPASVPPEPPRLNGVHVIEVSPPAVEGSSAAHLRQIDVLEQRIQKLTRLLEHTELELARLALLKDVDTGIASIRGNGQTLDAQGEAQAFKRSLMQNIFQANLELKTALARLPKGR